MANEIAVTNSRIFDVIIVGGGPAGAVAGVCLARAGARVAIIEADAQETDRFGETAPPEIGAVLRELGLWESFLALRPIESPGIVSQWGTPAPVEQDFIHNPHGAGWRIDRSAFDAMLLHQAKNAGAHVLMRQKAGTPERSNGIWQIDELRARFLIDAAGKNGLKIEACCERELDDVLLAICMVVTYPSSSSTDCRTYIETTPSGWWYSGRLPSGNAVAMFFTDPETYAAEVGIAEQLDYAPAIRERMQGGRIARSRVLYAPSACRKTLFGDGWLAAGDSASCYDPLSGMGIFKALRQGARAAQSVEKALDGESEAIADYARIVRREFESYVQQRRMYYAAERRWEGSDFWRRRRNSGVRQAQVSSPDV